LNRYFSRNKSVRVALSVIFIGRLSIWYHQKLIKGLKRVVRFYAPKYSKLINIFLTPESSIQNGGLAARQTHHEISLILSRFLMSFHYSMITICFLTILEALEA